jgi:RimJ/RimL family protein N-acetyltransferase
MAELMSIAHLAIGASGSNTLERLCIGLPSIAIPIAKNQMETCIDLYNSGAIFYLNEDKKQLVNRLKNMVIKILASQKKLLRLSDTSLKIVSCTGTKEVVDFLTGNLSINKLTHREAVMADCSLYMCWTNDSKVRKNAFNTAGVSWEEHQAWFGEQIKSSNSKLLIFESKYGPVGQVRMDGDASQKRISYSVARQFRGRGIGHEMISRIVKKIQLHTSCLIAHVKEDNVASIKIFEKLKFKRTSNIKIKAISFFLQTKK